MPTIDNSVRATTVGTSFKQQRGATLIVALVMLLLITLLAVGGMQGSIMQERMASNAHDGAISFQASEAGLRQAETDLIGTLATRQTAFTAARINTPWNWNGTNPTPSGTGEAGAGVSAQPIYHHARLADVCPIEPGQPCFERFEVTSRGQGGSPDAISVLQSTVLLPPQ
jgi:type IV pilus assembly protein PilX